MDSFSSILSIFSAPQVEEVDVSVPAEQETGGSRGSTSYCTIASPPARRRLSFNLLTYARNGLASVTPAFSSSTTTRVHPSHPAHSIITAFASSSNNQHLHFALT
ncbi:hypothetical protein FA15DRAFT_666027 [Coprinopsis marcescibilis]|uniref:Uncharacterized protein n=1 Tax=Coprinopsis marcescibilis TaxID=230819 RepID=A0A5C3L4Y1_COPMA|nr:hypothetical protein FA15DRAFT_666027 [Coprinopsis marcescibilis]